jgi:hypothetical protein
MNIILNILLILLGIAVIGLIGIMAMFAIILKSLPIRNKYSNTEVGANTNGFNTKN